MKNSGFYGYNKKYTGLVLCLFYTLMTGEVLQSTLNLYYPFIPKNN